MPFLTQHSSSLCLTAAPEFRNTNKHPAGRFICSSPIEIPLFYFQVKCVLKFFITMVKFFNASSRAQKGAAGPTRFLRCWCQGQNVKSRVQWFQFLLMGGRKKGRKEGRKFRPKCLCLEKSIMSLKTWKTSQANHGDSRQSGWLRRNPVEVRRCQWLLKITELWIHRMVWVERDLELISPCHGQEHLPLHLAAPSPIQPGCQYWLLGNMFNVQEMAT